MSRGHGGPRQAALLFMANGGWEFADSRATGKQLNLSARSLHVQGSGIFPRSLFFLKHTSFYFKYSSDKRPPPLFFFQVSLCRRRALPGRAIELSSRLENLGPNTIPDGNMPFFHMSHSGFLKDAGAPPRSIQLHPAPCPRSSSQQT